MNTALSPCDPYDPLVSEYDDAAHEARHTAWLQAKLAKSAADTSPNIPHDQVMAELKAILNRAK